VQAQDKFEVGWLDGGKGGAVSLAGRVGYTNDFEIVS
jgi:hypothetical protein